MARAKLDTTATSEGPGVERTCFEEGERLERMTAPTGKGWTPGSRPLVGGGLSRPGFYRIERSMLHLALCAYAGCSRRLRDFEISRPALSRGTLDAERSRMLSASQAPTTKH